MNTKTNKKGGFTIIELLVVIAIIGVLSGIILGNVSVAREKTRNVNRNSDIDQINKALELFAVSAKAFPSTGTTLNTYVCVKKTTCTHPLTGAIINSSPELTAALKPNMTAVPTDPYFSTGTGDDYTYSSNSTPTTVIGGPGAGFLPRGQYLSWVVEMAGVSTGSDKVCGHGKWAATPPNGFQCFLRLGTAN